LIQLLVVVAVIGLISAVGMPALWSILNKIKLKQAARETVAAMRGARYRAINEVRQFGVIARYDKRIQVFTGTDPTDVTAITQEIALPGGIAVRGIEAFVTNDDGGFVIFNPDGSADNAGAVTLGLDFPTPRPNEVFIEVRLEPATTARIRLRTFDPIKGVWEEKG
jgi:Tfp pilus assembly protein FimT